MLEANIQQNHISFEALLLASPVPLPRRGNDLRRAETQGVVVTVRRGVGCIVIAAQLEFSLVESFAAH